MTGASSSSTPHFAPQGGSRAWRGSPRHPSCGRPGTVGAPPSSLSTFHHWRSGQCPTCVSHIDVDRGSTPTAAGVDDVPFEPLVRRLRIRRGGPRTPLPLLPVIAVAAGIGIAYVNQTAHVTTATYQATRLDVASAAARRREPAARRRALPPRIVGADHLRGAEHGHAPGREVVLGRRCSPQRHRVAAAEQLTASDTGSTLQQLVGGARRRLRWERPVDEPASPLCRDPRASAHARAFSDGPDRSPARPLAGARLSRDGDCGLRPPRADPGDPGQVAGAAAARVAHDVDHVAGDTRRDPRSRRTRAGQQRPGLRRLRRPCARSPRSTARRSPACSRRSCR